MPGARTLRRPACTCRNVGGERTAGSFRGEARAGAQGMRYAGGSVPSRPGLVCELQLGHPLPPPRCTPFGWTLQPPIDPHSFTVHTS